MVALYTCRIDKCIPCRSILDVRETLCGFWVPEAIFYCVDTIKLNTCITLIYWVTSFPYYEKNVVDWLRNILLKQTTKKKNPGWSRFCVCINPSWHFSVLKNIKVFNYCMYKQFLSVFCNKKIGSLIYY